MALDTWSFVVAVSVFGLGAIVAAINAIAASRLKLRHVKKSIVRPSDGSVLVSNQQTQTLVYATTFIPSDLSDLPRMVDQISTRAVSVNTKVSDDQRYKAMTKQWAWVRPFDVSIAILFGIVFVGILGVAMAVSSFVDIGTYVRTDGIETFWIGHIAWGISLAIVACTCLWATASYKYPSQFQTLLVVGLCAVAAGISLAIGSFATDGRQYVGFAFGAFFTVCVGIFGLYDLFIYAADRKTFLPSYITSLRLVYGIAVLVGLARHVVLVLSPEYSNAIVLPSTASNIQFMIDAVAFAIIALWFFRARSELYRGLSTMTLTVFNIDPVMYYQTADAHHAGMMQHFYGAAHQQQHYMHPQGAAPLNPYYATNQAYGYPINVHGQVPFVPPAQGVPGAFTGTPSSSSV